MPGFLGFPSWVVGTYGLFLLMAVYWGVGLVAVTRAGVRARQRLSVLHVEQRLAGSRRSRIRRQLDAVAREFLGLWMLPLALVAGQWVLAENSREESVPLLHALLLAAHPIGLIALIHASVLLLPAAPPVLLVSVTYVFLMISGIALATTAADPHTVSVVILLAGLLAAFFADRRARRSPTAGGWTTA